MFKIGKKNKDKDPPVNSIMPGMIFNGDLETDGDILIEGSVIGSIKSNGKIIISESGEVKGDIGCESCDVSGIVEGMVVVEELMSIRDSSNIKGDIYAQSIECSEGAIINGTLNIGNEWKESLDDGQRKNRESPSKENKESSIQYTEGYSPEGILEYTD